MPLRQVTFSPNCYYHVFNKTISPLKPFTHERFCRRALFTLWFYQPYPSHISFSSYLQKSATDRLKIKNQLFQQPKQIEILTYCLMPNHFHLLIKEVIEGGIVRYLSTFQNCLSKYFNLKFHRQGPLFINRFKAVTIDSQEQLIHVSRYIHLNPSTSFLSESLTDLDSYPWSSWPEYMHQPFLLPITYTRDIMSQFKSIQSYREFCVSQIDYQRQLDLVKKMFLDPDDTTP